MPFTKGHPTYLLKHSEETKKKMRVPRTPRITLNCGECNNEFIVPKWRKDRAKYCSNRCKSKYNCKKYIAGKKHSKETLEKLSVIRKQNPSRYWLGKKRPDISRENNHKWIANRTELKNAIGSEERRSSKYKYWRKQVCLRDNFKCKIGNADCNGRLEVHHILGFTEYPELRYNINNGITLCHAHHPRKRAEEKRLSPYFMELVSVSK